MRFQKNLIVFVNVEWPSDAMRLERVVRGQDLW